jgi:hypothetical protein
MKIAVRRTYFGDRLCFPGIVPHAVLDLRAAYRRQLVIEGVCRADAVARAERTIAADMPALLRDDPELAEVRRLQNISSVLTLRPGDVLSTGAPAAVAPIVPGDVLRGEVEGLGVMESAVLRESAAAGRTVEGEGSATW